MWISIYAIQKNIRVCRHLIEKMVKKIKVRTGFHTVRTFYKPYLERFWSPKISHRLSNQHNAT